MWVLGAAAIAWLGRVDLAAALVRPVVGAASFSRRPSLVLGLQLARGLGILLVTAWLTQ